MLLLRYYLRRASFLGLCALGGLFLFQFIMGYVYRALMQNIEGVPALLLRVVPKNLQMFVGMDRLPPTTVAGFLVVVYQHPFALIVLCAVAIALSIKFLAGQVEQRALTHLLVRPMAHGLLPFYVFVAGATWLALAVGGALSGTVVSFQWLGFELPPWPQLAGLAATLYLLSLSVLGLSVLFSALCSTRSDAAGWTVTILLLMYVGNFVAQFWDAAKPWAKLSLFSFYRPIEVFTAPGLPLHAWMVFSALAAVALTVAAASYVVREFCI